MASAGLQPAPSNQTVARGLSLVWRGGAGLLIVIVAAAGAVGLAALLLGAPSKDLRDLFVFLLLSGGVSVVLGIGWLAWSGRIAHLTGLRTQLMVTYLVGAAIVIINLLITSSLMFFVGHDINLLALLVLFAAVVSLFFAYCLSDQLTRRVSTLRDGASRMAEGHFDTRVPENGPRELADLARVFNMMSVQLEAAFVAQQNMSQMRKELMAAISHDLRTPLASLRLMTEAVSDGVTDAAQTSLFLHRMRSEVEYMTGLIDDLFELSQLDAGALRLNLERGNMADLISDTLESQSSHAIRKNQTLEGHIEGELPDLSFDARKIMRVLNNLVGNAIRYTPEGGHITITGRSDGAWVMVSVEDNGEGISASDLERIFEPFYRGEHSRGRETGGTGLGLAIARGLIEAHGGRIGILSTEGRGSTFTIALPIPS